jgi:hypothetical protein
MRTAAALTLAVATLASAWPGGEKLPSPQSPFPGAIGTVRLGRAPGGPGDTVVIPVTLESHGGEVSVFEADIQFDPTALSPGSCTIDAAIGPDSATAKELATNLVGPGLVRFLLFGPNRTVVPDGVLFTCEFAILPNAPGGSFALTLQTVSAGDPDANGVPLSVMPGKIVVIGSRSPARGR